MERAYLRYYHTAEQCGEGCSTRRAVLRWFLIASLIVVSLSAVLSLPFSRWFGLCAWTTLAGGIVFLGDRWRFLGIEVLNIQRKRRAFAIHIIGFRLTQVTVVALVVYFVSPMAVAALLALGTVALLFAVFGVAPLVRGAFSGADSAPSSIRSMLIGFGMPFGALLAFQWIQNFADRYILAWQLDMAKAGVYVATFQVCGVPYMFLANLLDAFIRPIAYQRGADVRDPRQLWSADKVLIAAIALYVVVGGALLLAYGLFGPTLIVLLTSEAYRLPVGTVIVLALGRYVQCVTLNLQMFFEVHQTMTASLTFRLAGALFTVPAVWLAVHIWHSLLGAALGVLVAVFAYACLLSLGPNGVVWLVLKNRQGLRNASC
jgi:O-antigen/teichoic acid export membrane protein